MHNAILFTLILGSSTLAIAQKPATERQNMAAEKFAQLHQELPTPNTFRNAAGAPGHEYYQNTADYIMDITLDEAKQRITGSETVTYTNNSKDALQYLWLQLDQNLYAKDSDTKKVQTGEINERVPFFALEQMMSDFDGGFKIEGVTSADGKTLPYVVNKTMMRIDLAKPLMPGQKFSFKVKWWNNINDRAKLGGRSGLEYFKEDNEFIFTIAQFFPRMCVYNDESGWQNKQFLGQGEFTLPFGNYTVNLTVPSDHIVGATGVLQNANAILTAEQKKRWNEAQTSYEKPVLIVTQAEAEANEKDKSTDTKTWTYKAENVRDFAFATSRKFIWDAMAVKQTTKTVMAMSYYPKEGNPLWEQFSTKAVAQTLVTYSRHSFDYPYPVAISVHTDNIGMEYPMICFNGGRPEKDGSYSENTKTGMISVIIHEVGHNYFPMIVNSDERQWTWMDEGLNTFLQYLAEMDWDTKYPSRRGPAANIVAYMSGDPDKMVPIMTSSEQILQFGNNAYGKPATALNILRETIMGRELFDHAFKTYCQRWMFKHPSPADFFRTMEDASGVDLDWFWRGWFFTNEACDIALQDVKWFTINTKNPDVEKAFQKNKKNNEPKFQGDINYENAGVKTMVDKDPSTRDFYNSFDPFQVDAIDKQEYEKFLASLKPGQLEILNSGMNFYQITLENVGGLIMPVILELEYKNGKKEKMILPAEIWSKDDRKISKVIPSKEEIVRIVLDPNVETADIQRNNNYWPAMMEPSRFEVFEFNRKQENPIQRSKRASGQK